MDARLLTRITNVALVAAVGMTAGHVLMPVRADATPARRAGFLALVAASGALAGWRERRLCTEYRGAPAPRPGAWMPAGALVALTLAALAWWLVHG